ncbi:MAG: Stp1/IreP family PP2C-type Ser/Thr phosphatase [Clostridium sp.]|uniref:Stp1/IreP family PP2C-type Ser/Thr phosphatase n=1 Tax=Clostridium sp. DSM 8431 TaxID=1761781 RepID=UPI0008EEF774|nr:Stp1/IreP family PP2C-type Ser/Thr phosphatase [Clostridium sp. DSM 8431]MCR4944626.1 Stp1/IreP family PP2C-type Ser/Thr phosphatase [Clostridium sp.]SFU58035.1 protein phosphatase [Clostridium sp. DSM 8431]
MVGFLSDVGMVRSLNEDYLCYYESDEFSIYVVADGMGGHNAGEVASKMAAEGIIDFMKKYFNKNCCINILRDAISYVNSEIYNLSLKDSSMRGMGTTVTACLQISEKVIVANVGDSSCFGLKGNQITKITKDHSLVQELVDLGTITEDEAANHPKKNIITRAVGTGDIVNTDIFVIEKGTYDIYLLCSDGLTNEVTRDEIVSVISENKEFDNICDKLVTLAKDKGGRDNITVLLFGGEVV